MTEDTLKSFEFVAGWLCLDFVNTADGDVNEAWTEGLETYADLVAWCYRAGAIDEARANALLAVAAAHPSQAEAVRRDALALRLVIYRAFSDIAADSEPLPADLKSLEDSFYHMLPQTGLVRADDHFHRVWTGGEDALEQVIWPPVWSALELLQSDQLRRVRECGGDHCSWLFLDTSRNHSRRWCTMESCGNRAKARAHYRRSKGRDGLGS